MILYIYGTDNIYCGSGEYDPMGALPAFSTETPPPGTAGTEVAYWTGSGWVVLAERPAPPIPTNEQQAEFRKAAYTAEADPIYFMWQAGEATQAEWVAKREEIKARYPYYEEAA